MNYNIKNKIKKKEKRDNHKVNINKELAYVYIGNNITYI